MSKQIKITDMENAELFGDYYGNRFCHIPETNQYMLFTDDKGWQEKDGLLLTRDFIKDMHDKASKCDDNSARQVLGKRADDLEQLYRQKGMLELVRSYNKKNIGQFDRNRKLFSCLNCIVNLETKEMIPHSPDQLHIKRANASYDPSNRYPLKWINYLRDVFNDDWDYINWMQVAAGYSATALTDQHYFFICYGSGRNGKATFLDTIGHILNDYSYTALDVDAFLEKDKMNVRAKEVVGKLNGIRFAVASETGNSARFNTALIKKLTAENMLEGARLHVGSYQFKATHKIWFECNHLPGTKDGSIAMQERVKVCPFDQSYLVGEDQIKTLRDDFINEKDGILNWIIDGAYDYINGGFPPEPGAIIEATDNYLDANDPIRRYAKQGFVRDVQATTLAKDVYDGSYKAWCINNNIEMVPLTQFPTKLTERGIKCTKRSEGQTIIGWIAKEFKIYDKSRNQETVSGISGDIENEEW